MASGEEVECMSLRVDPTAAILVRVMGFKRGDRVRICSGPYSGCAASFIKVKANGRVVVRLPLSAWKGKRSTSRMDLSLDEIV